MGTVFSLDVRTAAPPGVFLEAVGAVSGRLRQIDDDFSPWKPDSWVSRLTTGEVTLEDSPPAVCEVVALSLDLMRVTDGYFSPFWRRLPYGEPGPDPTGMVKGWAAQQASDVLLENGLGDHVVNAAGDVVASGCSRPGDPDAMWHVGVSDPLHPGALLGFVNLDQSAQRWAVATSGTAEQGAHVSDPHTGGFPSSVASATVVTRLPGVVSGGAVADAWATALVAAGRAAPTLLETLDAAGLAGLLVTASGFVTDPRRLLQRA